MKNTLRMTENQIEVFGQQMPTKQDIELLKQYLSVKRKDKNVKHSEITDLENLLSRMSAQLKNKTEIDELIDKLKVNFENYNKNRLLTREERVNRDFPDFLKANN